MGDLEELIREVLSRRTPDGYYVVVVDKAALERLREKRGLRVIVHGGEAYIMTRSRREAARLIRLLREFLRY